MLRRLIAVVTGKPSKRRASATTVVDDGAWCWFADPRAVGHSGNSDAVYVGSVTSSGDIRITKVDLATMRAETAVLHSRLDSNDHANPSLLIDHDGYITVFYSAHDGPAMYARKSATPEDITDWLPESELRLNRGGLGRDAYTYPSPVSLAGEVCLFWRGDGWKPTMSVSRDGGVTWGQSRVVVSREDGDDKNRPYMKVTGADRFVDMAFTDGHPRDEDCNSIYFVRLQDRRFHRADGNRIAALDELPLDPGTADCVYDAAEHGARSWIWDVASDHSGRPAIVFSTFPREDEHRYWYARWTGSRWNLNQITEAGPWFPEDVPGQIQSEPHYSGGVVLDHQDVNVVFLSRQVDGVFEIERWETADTGSTWNRSPVTSGSRSSNVRPVAIRNRPSEHPQVMWMELSGGYTGYKDYKTSIRMA